MKIFTIFGTRPEALKMIPVIHALKKQEQVEVKTGVTSQHTAMLEQALASFNLSPSWDLQIMKPDQNLAELTQAAVGGLYELFQREKPDKILVQGDTTTAFSAALAAFYHKIPVGHIEAGLRSHNPASPWPEEINRRLTTVIADWHFAPTGLAAKNLLKEGIEEQKIFITGNTIIDLLLETKRLITAPEKARQLQQQFPWLDPAKKLLLVTAHRRESFGQSLEAICKALASLSRMNNVQLVFPVHLNPNVQKPVNQYLKNIKNIFLMPPLDYFSLVYLLEKSYLVLTDSGGIQEEAPTFGKPVLVMRQVTERMEGIHAGLARLVGTQTQEIVENTTRLIEDETAYAAMTGIPNPYGDGRAAERIAEILLKDGFAHFR